MTTFPDPNSIVDTLKSKGIDSSFANRTKLAGTLGIQNYTGTAEQNIALNKYYQSQTSPFQDTTAQRGKDAMTGAQVEEKAKAITGSPTSTDTRSTDGTATVVNGQITGTDGKTYTTSAPSGYSFQLPALEAGQKWVYDPEGKPMVQDATGKIVSNQYAEEQYQANKESILKQKEFENTFDTYKKGLDETHVALIDAIKQQAQQQKAKMEELNKRMLGAKRVQGFRTGATEYTPEIGTGILKAEQEEGLARLAEIDSKMLLAIAEAKSAKTDKDFDMAYKKLELANKLQKDKETTIQNIYKSYVDNMKAIDDRLKAIGTEERATRDQALQELGTSAPALVKQYDSLKNDADRTAWLDIVSKRTGLDRAILLGSLEKARTEAKKSALDIADKQSLINKRNKDSDGGGVSYTSTELKKLRAEGIDPTNTKMADAFLYKGTTREEYASTIPQITKEDLNFSFGLNLQDMQDKLDRINEALVEGYPLREVLKYMGFSDGMIQSFEQSYKKIAK